VMVIVVSGETVTDRASDRKGTGFFKRSMTILGLRRVASGREVFD